MNTDSKGRGRPQRHRWVYLALDAVRKNGGPVNATPSAKIDATRRALVKSIVAASNRGNPTKVRVIFSADETTATFVIKT